VVPSVMSYWTLPELVGALIWVLRPDGVMGEAAWIEMVGYTNRRRSEKKNTRQRFSHTCPACCSFKADLLWDRSFYLANTDHCAGRTEANCRSALSATQ
jgi:hypothetical protein